MKVTSDRFDPSAGSSCPITRHAVHLRTPQEGDALVDAAREWQGVSVKTETIADLALAALLDLLRDCPADATLGDLRRQLEARATQGMMERERDRG